MSRYQSAEFALGQVFRHQDERNGQHREVVAGMDAVPKGRRQHRHDGPQGFEREGSVNVDNEPPLDRHVPRLEAAANVGKLGRVLVDIVDRLEIEVLDVFAAGRELIEGGGSLARFGR